MPTAAGNVNEFQYERKTGANPAALASERSVLRV
jgi:hypothetical protein